jgi:hypothetical protein
VTASQSYARILGNPYTQFHDPKIRWTSRDASGRHKVCAFEIVKKAQRLEIAVGRQLLIDPAQCNAASLLDNTNRAISQAEGTPLMLPRNRSRLSLEENFSVLEPSETLTDDYRLARELPGDVAFFLSWSS